MTKFLHVSQPIADVLLKQGLVVLMPSAQRGPALGDVRSCPHDAQLIKLASGLIVGAEDVELAQANVIEHVKNRLFSSPGARGFRTARECGQTSEGPSWTMGAGISSDGCLGS